MTTVSLMVGAQVGRPTPGQRGKLDMRNKALTACSNKGNEAFFGNFTRINHTDNSYGYNQHRKAFVYVISPIIIFFSGIIQGLYHIGLMEYIIDKISWLMEATLGVTGPESIGRLTRGNF